MPNHCCNTLFMSEDELSVIIEKYIRKDERGEDIFDFELIEPIGEPSDWYNRRCEKWGTKWVGYDLIVSDSSIDFFTAWSPPLPIIKKLAELHKDFTFRLEYNEPGMAFRGVYSAEWRDGEVLDEDDYWDMTDKDFEELGLLPSEKNENRQQNNFEESL